MSVFGPDRFVWQCWVIFGLLAVIMMAGTPPQPSRKHPNEGWIISPRDTEGGRSHSFSDVLLSCLQPNPVTEAPPPAEPETPPTRGQATVHWEYRGGRSHSAVR